MTCHDYHDRFDAYLDRTLDADSRRALDAHLAGCAACRQALAGLLTLREQTSRLPRDIVPPRDLWPEIQATLAHTLSADTRSAPVGPRSSRSEVRHRLRWLPFLSLGIAAALVMAFFLYSPEDESAPSWALTPLTGTIRLDANTTDQPSRLKIGQWLETDAISRVELAVGEIGRLEISPNSRLRLLEAGATDHRIELSRGTLDAFIWAPPRLFFVETPSATAIDLGCAYTLVVDEEGRGELHVTAGYVALENGGRSAIVPAGLRCRMQPGAGPGTPYADDAPADLRQALDRFDFGPDGGSPAALSAALLHIREGDTVTLWHLLSRAPATARGAVFDRLAMFAPPPTSVTRDGILAADRAMLGRWAEALGLVAP